MTKIFAKHPTIQPENYQKSKESKDLRVKSLFLPFSNLMYPELIFDLSSNIKRKVFYNSEDIYLLPLHPYYHIYIDRSLQYDLKNDNIDYSVPYEIVEQIARYYDFNIFPFS